MQNAIIHIDTVGAQNFVPLLQLVTPYRREKVLRYTLHNDRLRCLAAGLLLKNVLGITNDSEIGYGPQGKPFLVNHKTEFNLSHGGNYVILVTDNNPVGVDIEKIESFDESVAHRCFTADECATLFAEKDIAKQQELFYTLWTGKEAIMKATGLGLSFDPQSFSLHSQTDWQLQWQRLDNHIYCVATTISVQII